ncbi:MAG: response regulator [Bacteroidota bacterium]
MKVLVIEDEQLAADRLIRLIQKNHPSYNIIGHIDTVRDGIKLLSQENVLIDLIFCDIHLADGKCFEIFGEVKTNIPIIFTTAWIE